MAKQPDSEDMHREAGIGQEHRTRDAKAAYEGVAAEDDTEGDLSAEQPIDPAERVLQLEELVAQNRDQVLRARAELENQRRRFDRELEAAHKFAVERFAQELLSVCDSLEMGLEAARKGGDLDRFLEGSELTLKTLLSAFEKVGIETVDPTHERFDPDRHQAMTTQESTEYPPNTVLLTMQKGYLLQGRVLRPAMVIVSRAPTEA